MLINVGVERAIIAGICQFGNDAMVDIEDIGVTSESFVDSTNQILFICLRQVLMHSDEVDQAALLVTINELGYNKLFSNRKDVEYIGSLFTFPIKLHTIREFAKKLEKLVIARKAIAKHKEAIQNLNNVTGNEDVDAIVQLSEEPVFDLILDINKGKTGSPELLFENIEELIQNLTDNPQDSVGIPTPWPQYNGAIGGGLRRGGVNLISSRPKCLVHGSKVCTINGFKNIENISTNDILIDPYNNHTKINEIYNHNDLNIYRVYFRDGDYVDCCEDHLWKVYTSYQKGILKNKKHVLKTTKELSNNIYIGNPSNHKYKWNVELCGPIEFPHIDVEVDPYTLGVLIGDGTLYHTAKFVSHINDIDEIKTYIEEAYPNKVKFDYKKPNSNCETYRINSLKKKIEAIGLWKHNCYNKFIPKQYIYNDINTRVEILRGLMDTDGDCTLDKKSNNTRCRFGTVSHQLALDVKEIVQSLGGLCSINITHTKCNNKIFKSYRCEIRLPHFNPFKLKRKSLKYSPRKIGELKRTIVNIEYLRKDKAICFDLDSENHLFLTDNFVVTHNCGKTTLAKEFLLHFTQNLEIPVLFLDTEMSSNDQIIRSIASQSRVSLDDIETGNFINNIESTSKVEFAVNKLKNNKLLYYKSIAGKPFDEVLAIIRRWIVQHVGYDDDGQTKDCVIVYDYFKLMDRSHLDNLKEYEALGYQISKLTDFCKEFDFPCLAFVQLNRQHEVSQSDRLIWLCNSFSKFEIKTTEEIADDGGTVNGNRKLIVCETRFGGGLDEDDYICINFERSINKMTEIDTKSNIQKRNNTDTFGTSDENASL